VRRPCLFHLVLEVDFDCLLQLKEAYDVLSDPKKRKLYDQIGGFGLKLLENPTPGPETFTILIKNFQKNKADACYVFLFIALIFMSLFILPILFSLKCDGSLDSSVPWIALWSPMWVVDLVFLIAAFALFSVNNYSKNADSEDDVNDSEMNNVPLSFKIFNLCTTILFILIQIFVLIRLDDEIRWSWFRVFAPWFIYEGLWFMNYIPSITSRIKYPEKSSNDALDEELMTSQAKSELEYYEKLINRWRDFRTVITIALRFWFAIFLALKLDKDVDWNWGLVMLPIWIYLVIQYTFVMINRSWGKKLLLSVEDALIAAGGDLSSMDPSMAVRAQVGSELMQGSFSDCFFQFLPIYFAILLVSRLQVQDFSTFLILLPVFLILGCCCCGVLCFILCFGAVDADELSAAFAEHEQGEHGDSSSSNNSPNKADVENQASYTPPPATRMNDDAQVEIDEVYGVQPDRLYGTFPETPPHHPPAAAPPAAAVAAASSESILVEID
jgi:hypothetical protein